MTGLLGIGRQAGAATRYDSYGGNGRREPDESVFVTGADGEHKPYLPESTGTADKGFPPGSRLPGTADQNEGFNEGVPGQIPWHQADPAASRGGLLGPQQAPDMTEKYNTKLTPEEDGKFEQWRASLPPNLRNMNDYDLRGAFKAGAEKSPNDHMTDQFKKPNHMTFSNGSQYHGVDGNEGGTWLKNVDGTWTFRASPTNVQMNGREQMQDYFTREEKGNRLVLPEEDR